MTPTGFEDLGFVPNGFEDLGFIPHNEQSQQQQPEQQQGFAQFQELDGTINFDCTGQCFALIGPLAGSDYISLNGTLQENGVVGYGFVVGQQIIPGDTVQVN